jgi:hypothetical protein
VSHVVYLDEDADLRARVKVREDGAFEGLFDKEADLLAASISARQNEGKFDNSARIRKQQLSIPSLMFFPLGHGKRRDRVLAVDSAPGIKYCELFLEKRAHQI